MIEVKLKTQSKEKIKTFIPNDWSLLTCNQIIQLLDVDLNDTPLVLEILTGVESNLWKQVQSDKMKPIISELEFLKTEINFPEDKAPKSLDVKGVKVKVPNKIEFETWGQKLYIEERLNEFKELDNQNLFKLYPFIVSVYLSPYYYDEQFDEERVKEFEEKLMDMHALEIYQIAGFFLLNLMTGYNVSRRSYNILLLKKNNKPGLKAFRHLAILQRLTH